MKKRSILSLCCLAFLTFSSSAWSASEGSGTVHFVGSIVEDGCAIQHQQKRIDFNCPVGNKWVNQSISVARIDTANLKSNVPAHVKLHYLDSSKKVAVLNISYQ